MNIKLKPMYFTDKVIEAYRGQTFPGLHNEWMAALD